MRTRSSSRAKSVVAALVEFARHSNLSFAPFVWEWVCYALLQKYSDDSPSEIKKLISKARTLLGYRPEAEAARVYRRLGWVRQYKETWNTMGP